MFRLLGEDGTIHVSATPGLLCGNGHLKIYGQLTCASAKRAVAAGTTYQAHRVFFADEPAAIATGYRPCGKCMRDEYKIWRAAQ